MHPFPRGLRGGWLDPDVAKRHGAVVASQHDGPGPVAFSSAKAAALVGPVTSTPL